MIPTPLSGRVWPRPWRGVPRLLVALLGVLLGAAEPQAPPKTLLREGFTAEREIHGGEVHVYPVELQAGQFLRVSVQEQAIDLIVRLAGPWGKVVTGVDGLPSGEAKEDLAFIATETGSHELRVSVSTESGAGRYSLQVETLGETHEADRVLAEAVRATWEGCTADGLSAGDQVRLLERALDLWQQIGNSKKSAEVLYCLGEARHSLGTNDQAAAADFQRSASLWAQQPGRVSKIQQFTLLLKAGRLLKDEHPTESRSVLEQALALARDLGDPGLQAASLNVLGQLDVAEAEVLAGLERQQQALALAQQAKNRKLEAVILNNLAVAYDQLSEVQKALDSNEKALEIARQNGDQKAETRYLNNLGVEYRSLGNWEKAVGCYRRAAELSRTDKNARGLVLINLAVAYQNLGQLAQARRTFDQARALGHDAQSRRTLIFAEGNLALLLLQMKQPAEAVAHAREAVRLAGSPEEENFSHLVLGKALRAIGDAAGAETKLDNALALAQRRDAHLAQVEIHQILAEMARDKGDLLSARSHVDSAIGLIESRRGRVVDQDLRTSFLASKHDLYELKVSILMALNQRQPDSGLVAEALRTSEQARARGLLEILNEGTDVRQGADPALLAKERRLRGEVNALDLRRWELLATENPDSRKAAEAGQQLDQALEAYGRVRVELQESNPAYAALTQPLPIEVEEIQRRLLDGKALLLEYFLGAERSFLWAVAADSVQSFELPGRGRIEKAARRYYAQLTARNQTGDDGPARHQRIAAADAEAEKAGRELSRLILQPVRKFLNHQPLLIVADGALHYIPFAALPSPATGAPLASRHQILSLPSASVLAVIRRELRDRSPAPKRLAVFADAVFERDDERIARYPLKKTRPGRLHRAPSQGRRGAAAEGQEAAVELPRLHMSHREADAIAALLRPSELYRAEGFAASRAAVLNARLDQYRIVHFATHGVLRTDHPELSKLVLSLYNQRGEGQDGFLRLNDVYNLRLNADLVVLSACQTALGKEIRGEGLVGLTRGFMYAGAARVLASLWSVEDRATAELMGNFYRGMLRKGLTPAEALRQAQLEIAREPAWKSPYYWAGFSLQGEWR